MADRIEHLAALAEQAGKLGTAEWLRTCALLPIEEWPPAPAYKGPVVPAAERDALQARIDAALAVLDEPVSHVRRTDPGLMSMNARRNQEELIQRVRAALQGDQPEVPGG